LEGDQIRFGPAPNAVYTVRLEYWSAIPSLAQNSTNWLLTNYPDCYLFGALVEAEIFLGADSSDDRFSTFMQRREAAYQAIGIADRKFRTGGAQLQMRTDTGNP